MNDFMNSLPITIIVVSLGAALGLLMAIRLVGLNNRDRSDEEIKYDDDEQAEWLGLNRK